MMRAVQVTKVVCDNEKQDTCTVLSELPVRPTAILDLMKQEQEKENKYPCIHFPYILYHLVSLGITYLNCLAIFSKANVNMRGLCTEDTVE